MQKLSTRLRHIKVKAPVPAHLQGKELYLVTCYSDDVWPLLLQDPDMILTQAWYPYNQIKQQTIQKFLQKGTQKRCAFIYAVAPDSIVNSAIYMSHDVISIDMENHDIFKYQIRI